jgi:transposase-like protein
MAFLDAIHIKVRHENKVINEAANIVLAYDLNGKKEIQRALYLRWRRRI